MLTLLIVFAFFVALWGAYRGGQASVTFREARAFDSQSRKRIGL